MHSRSEPCTSRMRELDVNLLRTANASACSVATGPSRTKHSSATLGVFIARMFQKRGAIESYSVTLLYHDLSFGEHPRTPYEDGDLKVDVVQLTK